MGRSIVFVNQKGGVGKTTSVINIGAYFARAGLPTLLIDFDPQANLSSSFGIKPEKKDIYRVLSKQIGINNAICPTQIPELSILGTSIDLSGATIELVGKEHSNEYLKHALQDLEKDYAFILIDCPPSLGLLTLNGLVAANEVIIPLQCEYFALEGLSLILRTINMVQKSINPLLTICGILFTMYDSRTRLAQDVVRQVSAYFKDRVFGTIIPRNIRLSEAPSYGKPISLYDPTCIGAKSYETLATEICNRKIL